MARGTARQYGYSEIRTPIIERTDLFQRNVGETSDIVSKEMYTFDDAVDALLSLRPEGTAPVIRAFLNARCIMHLQSTNCSISAPMFRYDRPQAGRTANITNSGQKPSALPHRSKT